MGIADIAWPGPRPLAKDDELAGRRDELEEMLDVCRTYEIVQLTAKSGIGKTSFVKAGLLPMLEAANAVVPPIIPWPEATDKLGPNRHELDALTAAKKLYCAAIGGSADDDREPVETLNEIAGQRAAVVVLDQFEELLRYQPVVGEKLLRLVGGIARRTGIPHIIVARSEYREDLRPVEESGATVWSLYLPEITSDEALRSIAMAPALAQHIEIHDSTCRQLIKWWSEARLEVVRRRAQRVGLEGVADIGLLHFQALLWSFKHWAIDEGLTDFREADGERKADVERYAVPRLLGVPDVTEANRGLRLFEDALAGYVRQRADRLSISPMLNTPERVRPLRWQNGPRVMLARAAPAMTAAGYKQAQSLYSLIPNALGDELTQTRARHLSRRLLALGESVADQQPRTEITAEFGVPGAGIGAGWRRGDVVEEMIDCLHAALQGMSGDANILRQYDRPGQPIYELVHDGMGSALDRWAEEFVDGALAKVGVIAEQPGRVMDANISGSDLLAMSAETRRLWGDVQEHPDWPGRATLKQLRWPASAVVAKELELTLQNLVFQDCDFTGASFTRCAMSNVTFDRCNLTGAVMLDCHLDGVTLRASRAPHQREWMDLLTIKFTDRFFQMHPHAATDDAARVTFEDLSSTTGLFLQGLVSGSWTFERSKIRNLVITAHDRVVAAEHDVNVKFSDTNVVPLSVYSKGVSMTQDDDSSIFRLSTE